MGEGCQLRGRLDLVVENLLQHGASPDRREGRIDACGLVLVRQFDDIRGTVIELASIAGGLVLGRPSRRTVPDQLGPLGVVAHDDDGCRIPLATLLQQEMNMVEIAVGQRQIVEIGGPGFAERPGPAIVNPVRMWNRHMNQ